MKKSVFHVLGSGKLDHSPHAALWIRFPKRGMVTILFSKKEAQEANSSLRIVRLVMSKLKMLLHEFPAFKIGKNIQVEKYTRNRYFPVYFNDAERGHGRKFLVKDIEISSVEKRDELSIARLVEKKFRELVA